MKDKVGSGMEADGGPCRENSLGVCLRMERTLLCGQGNNVAKARHIFVSCV